MNWQEIEIKISESTGQGFHVERSRSVVGGSINSAYVLEGETKNYFVKLNAKHLSEMFAAEAEGLMELAAPKVIHVPLPLVWGETATHSFIVMENISFASENKAAAESFGTALAKLHRTESTQFGWYRENTIGSTPQINVVNDRWVDFYRTQRLQYQFELAVKNGASGELITLGNKLCDNLDEFFKSYQPAPSLLHGDLWSGNYGYDEIGRPVIFDPAVYFGDRETDIAMTELFGGFSEGFYDAYNDVYALDNGYYVRKKLYNLYHVLNHFNLFGGGYQSQAKKMITGLLSEI